MPHPLPKAPRWPRRKPSRKPYTRNWRLRSRTPPLPTTHVFSEDSIQRQLGGYVAPSRYDEGYYDGGEYGEDGDWLGGDTNIMKKCCWHYWGGSGSVESVWCCGGTCACLEDTLAPGSPAHGDDGFEHIAVEMDAGEGMSLHSRLPVSMSAPESPRIVELVGESVNGKKMLWRDEWECDFCGSGCFCWTVDEKGGDGVGDGDEGGDVVVAEEVS